MLWPHLGAKRAPASRKAARRRGMGVTTQGKTMVRMVAFCRPLLAALALVLAAIAATVSPAPARPHHGASRHVHAYHHIGHHARWQQARYHSRHQYRRV